MITVATYNVLATAYIKQARYPSSPEVFLDAKTRLPALATHLTTLNADLLCLQEVEENTFAIINRALSPLGYVGALTMKGSGKPDGCATFVRKTALEWGHLTRLEYDDASGTQERSGHIAQLVILTWEGRLLGVANTHLKWDPPSTPQDYRSGYRQLTELLRVRQNFAPECKGWIICGDFNVTRDDDLIRTLQRSGFHYSHAHAPGVATCNSNQRAKMIDYLFHNETIASTALELPQVHNTTPLPGPDQPSDHIAVIANLQWKAEQ
ncbi:MAG: endonuclease/exonuclease/phosphatase family protein [Candidatus Binatia bacterium]